MRVERWEVSGSPTACSGAEAATTSRTPRLSARSASSAKRGRVLAEAAQFRNHHQELSIGRLRTRMSNSRRRSSAANWSADSSTGSTARVRCGSSKTGAGKARSEPRIQSRNCCGDRRAASVATRLVRIVSAPCPGKLATRMWPRLSQATEYTCRSYSTPSGTRHGWFRWCGAARQEASLAQAH